LRKAPDDVVLEDDEGWRITRAQLALELHVLPTDIDGLPIRDVMDLLALINDRNKKHG
jgi:hypothetical protein